MMSSEEETDCFALYGASNNSTDSKQQQLLKKQKRTRQRVDAGEPRNSYSSIPNFSSRPSFLGGGIYGSIFNNNSTSHSSQQQQQQQQSATQPQQSALPNNNQLVNNHLTSGTTASQQAHSGFGFYFGAPGFGPPNSKMLNELFGRQVKQATDASGGGSPTDVSHAMSGLDGATGLQPGQLTGCDDPSNTPELTQHMLREILQGRKLSALSVQEQPTNNNSILTNNIHNNNSIHNNNNNNTTTDLLKSQQQQQQQHSPQQQQQNNNSESARSGGTVLSGNEDSGDSSGAGGVGSNNLSSSIVVNHHSNDRDSVLPADITDDSAEDAASAARAMEEAFADAGMEPGTNLDNSDCEQSLPSSPNGPRSTASVSVKEELIQDHLLKRSPSGSPCPSIIPKTETNSPTTEIKRARVENIVSTMRSSPALHNSVTVNGCKKRKLYHPQQQTVHHVLQQHSIADSLLDDDDESDDEEDYAMIRQKREEKHNLKSQLDKLYEQVAVMQQKYAELSSRMGPETNESSDAPTSPPLPREQQLPSRSARSHMPTFNGGLPSLPHEHAAAAAMYQSMVNQKYYLEQERYATVERLKREQQQQQEAVSRQQREHHHHQQQQQRGQEQLHQQQQQQQRRSLSPVAAQQQSRQEAPLTPHLQRLAANKTAVMQNKDVQESLSALRGAVEVASSSLPHITGTDLEGLAESLKTEITTYLTNLIDSIVTRYLQQRKFLSKQTEAAQASAEQLNNLNKDLMLASQFLERKSPRTKVVDRGATQQLTGGPNGQRGPLNGGPPSTQQQQQATQQQQQQQQGGFSPIGTNMVASGAAGSHGPHSGLAENNLNQLNQLPPHARGTAAGLFQTPKPPTIYSMATTMQQQQQQQQQQREQREREHREFLRDDRESRDSEQNEALSLVMTPKKKRHKVTDTRITPRTVSRILAQEGSVSSQGGNESPPPPTLQARPSYHAPPILPVSLPTSVAIPNPGLHESQVFSPYSPFFNPHVTHGQVPPSGSHHVPASPPSGGIESRDSPPPLQNPPAMLHPAFLAAAAQHSNQDYGHLRMDTNDRNSDCNSVEFNYDGIQPTSSTLTPMHLRKAKLMFFWVRYPSSAVLKMYFPDIKFNKNNTAQLVKWFSNFREFYYIQMEKYARQAVSEGVKTVEDLQVGGDSEIYRVLNLHYNRNNHIEVPPNFRYVVEQTLKEFFKAIQGGKDTEQSWKKSIYKVISRLDDPVPEYFKTPNFLETLDN